VMLLRSDSHATVLWTAAFSARRCECRDDDRPAGRALLALSWRSRGAQRVVAGDASHDDPGWSPRPGVAQAAIQRPICRTVIANRVRGRKDGRPFRYRNKGNMAVVGKNFAILEAGDLRSSGFVTWLMWAALHRARAAALQNRSAFKRNGSVLSVGQRSSRLISEGPRSSAL